MQQPSSREMPGGGSGGHDDFFDQMLSTLPPTWADLGSGKSPWDLGGGVGGANGSGPGAGGDDSASTFDESSLLASRLRQHQIGSDKPMMLHLRDLHQHSLGGGGTGEEHGGGAGGFLPLPLFVDRSRDELEGAFKSPNGATGDVIYSGLMAQVAAQAPFAQGAGFGGGAASGGGGTQAGAASSGGGNGSGGVAQPPRQQRVRARRGQATDPHSIAERLRRERIAERMKALQELVPNANKTDKASMLDEIIDYVKFLQLQVKVLSMSRLGGAAAVAPLVANMSSEGSGSGGGGGGAGGNGNGESGSLRVTEQQVARLMEEDMGSAMQYLQGKGLCLMPISLASAISSATSSSFLSRPPSRPVAGSGPSSPGLANGNGCDKDSKGGK